MPGRGSRAIGEVGLVVDCLSGWGFSRMKGEWRGGWGTCRCGRVCGMMGSGHVGGIGCERIGCAALVRGIRGTGRADRGLDREIGRFDEMRTGLVSGRGLTGGIRRMVKRRRLVVGLVVAAVLLLVVSGGSAALFLRQRSFQAELAEGRAFLAAGNHNLAIDRLSRLSKRWTNDGEVYLLLGQSELERAQSQPPDRVKEAREAAAAALAAWSQVARGSPHYGRACLLRATHLINTGHYAPAEETLLKALEDARVEPRYELERALSRVYRFQGRIDEVREIVRGGWSRSPTPAADLKELWLLDHSPMPMEAWKRALKVADNDDDRVWLGRASVAIATGEWNEAATWLERCSARREHDPAVWRAWLELAVASQDEAQFWPALAELPAAAFDAAGVLKLRAWLFAVRRDPVGEERELESPGRGRSGQYQGTRAAGGADGGAEPGEGIRGMASQEGRRRPRPRPIPKVPL